MWEMEVKWVNEGCYPGVCGRIATINVNVIEKSRKRCICVLEFPGSCSHLGTMYLDAGHFLGSCTCQILSELSNVLRMSGKAPASQTDVHTRYINTRYLVLSCEPCVFHCASLCCLTLKSAFCKISMPWPFLRVMVKIKRGHRYESSVVSRW